MVLCISNIKIRFPTFGTKLGSSAVVLKRTGTHPLYSAIAHILIHSTSHYCDLRIAQRCEHGRRCWCRCWCENSQREAAMQESASVGKCARVCRGLAMTSGYAAVVCRARHLVEEQAAGCCALRRRMVQAMSELMRICALNYVFLGEL